MRAEFADIDPTDPQFRHVSTVVASIEQAIWLAAKVRERCVRFIGDLHRGLAGLIRLLCAKPRELIAQRLGITPFTPPPPLRQIESGD